MSPNASLFQLGRRPFLDGIRGIAILLVMLYHTRDPILPGGHIGVNIFFVLSGFLITSILVEEWSRVQAIDFRRFYLRRGLRLAPALFALVIAMVIVKMAASAAGFSLGENEPSLVWSSAASIFYFANWAKAYDWFELGVLTHTWSLSIEEQFYMIWPIALLGMLRAGWRHITMIGVMACAALVSVILRHITFEREDFDRAYNGLDTRADGLLIGGILALVMAGGLVPRSKRASGILTGAAVIGAAVVALAAATWGESDPWLYYRGGFLLTAIGTAMVMFRYLVDPTGIGNVLLSSRLLGWFGMISYGLYIWHMPVYWFINKMSLPTVADVPLRIAVSIAAAVISYCLIEKPFLRLKNRIPARTATSIPEPTTAAIAAD